MPAAEAERSNFFVESWKEFGHMTLSALLDIPEWYYSSTYPKEWDMQAGEPPTTCGQGSAHAVGNASNAPASAIRAWLFATRAESGQSGFLALCHQLLWHRSCSISVTLAEKILEAMFPDPKVLTKIRELEQPTLDRCQLSSKAGLLSCLEAGSEPSYMERLRRIKCRRAYIGSFLPACFTTLCLSTLRSCTSYIYAGTPFGPYSLHCAARSRHLSIIS